MAQSIKDANLIQFADTALLDNWITSYTFCKVFPGWMICPNSACHLPIILSENCNLWSDENVTYKVKVYADTSFLQYKDKTSQKYLVMLLLKCRRRHEGFGHWLCTKLAVSSSVFRFQSWQNTCHEQDCNVISQFSQSLNSFLSFNTVSVQSSQWQNRAEVTEIPSACNMERFVRWCKFFCCYLRLDCGFLPWDLFRTVFLWPCSSLLSSNCVSLSEW